jgi:hypothetical protein
MELLYLERVGPLTSELFVVFQIAQSKPLLIYICLWWQSPMYTLWFWDLELPEL